jgi:hypothetical protein
VEVDPRLKEQTLKSLENLGVTQVFKVKGKRQNLDFSAVQVRLCWNLAALPFLVVINIVDVLE